MVAHAVQVGVAERASAVDWAQGLEGRGEALHRLLGVPAQRMEAGHVAPREGVVHPLGHAGVEGLPRLLEGSLRLVAAAHLQVRGHFLLQLDEGAIAEDVAGFAKEIQLAAILLHGLRTAALAVEDAAHARVGADDPEARVAGHRRLLERDGLPAGRLGAGQLAGSGEEEAELEERVAALRAEGYGPLELLDAFRDAPRPRRKHAPQGRVGVGVLRVEAERFADRRDRLIAAAEVSQREAQAGVGLRQPWVQGQRLSLAVDGPLDQLGHAEEGALQAQGAARLGPGRGVIGIVIEGLLEEVDRPVEGTAIRGAEAHHGAGEALCSILCNRSPASAEAAA